MVSASLRSGERWSCSRWIAFARHRAMSWSRSSPSRCVSYRTSSGPCHRASTPQSGRSRPRAAVAANRSCDQATPRNEAAATRHRGTGRVTGVRGSISSPFNLPSRGPGAHNPEIEQAPGQPHWPRGGARAVCPELSEIVEEETRPCGPHSRATTRVERPCVECHSHVARSVSSFSATRRRSAIRYNVRRSMPRASAARERLPPTASST